MRTHRMEPRESVKLIATLTYYRKISGVVAGGKVLAVPLLALFLVPFLIEAAQAFQRNSVDYRPAVTQPVNPAPLGGMNRSKTFFTNRSNYVPTVTRSVKPGVTQMNNKMGGTGNKNMNINALRGKQTFKQKIGILRNNATNLNPNLTRTTRNNATNLNPDLTRTTGVNANKSGQKNVDIKIYTGAPGKKVQY